jgi:hypothetical protein
VRYAVTATGPLGFQVTVSGFGAGEKRLMADFNSLVEAEAFAAAMRMIDKGRTYLTVPMERP